MPTEPNTENTAAAAGSDAAADPSQKRADHQAQVTTQREAVEARLDDLLGASEPKALSAPKGDAAAQSSQAPSPLGGASGSNSKERDPRVVAKQKLGYGLHPSVPDCVDVQLIKIDTENDIDVSDPGNFCRFRYAYDAQDGESSSKGSGAVGGSAGGFGEGGIAGAKGSDAESLKQSSGLVIEFYSGCRVNLKRDHGFDSALPNDQTKVCVNYVSGGTVGAGLRVKIECELDRSVIKEGWVIDGLAGALEKIVDLNAKYQSKRKRSHAAHRMGVTMEGIGGVVPDRVLGDIAPDDPAALYKAINAYWEDFRAKIDSGPQTGIFVFDPKRDMKKFIFVPEYESIIRIIDELKNNLRRGLSSNCKKFFYELSGIEKDVMSITFDRARESLEEIKANLSRLIARMYNEGVVFGNEPLIVECREGCSLVAPDGGPLQIVKREELCVMSLPNVVFELSEEHENGFRVLVDEDYIQIIIEKGSPPNDDYDRPVLVLTKTREQAAIWKLNRDMRPPFNASTPYQYHLVSDALMLCSSDEQPHVGLIDKSTTIPGINPLSLLVLCPSLDRAFKSISERPLRTPTFRAPEPIIKPLPPVAELKKARERNALMRTFVYDIAPHLACSLDMDQVLLLGLTGHGKSTLVNYLLGHEFYDGDESESDEDDDDDEGQGVNLRTDSEPKFSGLRVKRQDLPHAVMGEDPNNSCTRAVRSYASTRLAGVGAIADCPGWRDSNEAYDEIHRFTLAMARQLSRSTKAIIFLIDTRAVLSTRSDAFSKFLDEMQKTFRVNDLLKFHRSQCFFIMNTFGDKGKDEAAVAAIQAANVEYERQLKPYLDDSGELKNGSSAVGGLDDLYSKYLITRAIVDGAGKSNPNPRTLAFSNPNKRRLRRTLEKIFQSLDASIPDEIFHYSTNSVECKEMEKDLGSYTSGHIDALRQLQEEKDKLLFESFAQMVPVKRFPHMVGMIAGKLSEWANKMTNYAAKCEITQPVLSQRTGSWGENFMGKWSEVNTEPYHKTLSQEGKDVSPFKRVVFLESTFDSSVSPPVPIHRVDFYVDEKCMSYKATYKFPTYRPRITERIKVGSVEGYQVNNPSFHDNVDGFMASMGRYCDFWQDEANKFSEVCPELSQYLRNHVQIYLVASSHSRDPVGSNRARLNRFRYLMKELPRLSDALIKSIKQMSRPQRRESGEFCHGSGRELLPAINLGWLFLEMTVGRGPTPVLIRPSTLESMQALVHEELGKLVIDPAPEDDTIEAVRREALRVIRGYKSYFRSTLNRYISKTMQDSANTAISALLKSVVWVDSGKKVKVFGATSVELDSFLDAAEASPHTGHDPVPSVLLDASFAEIQNPALDALLDEIEHQFDQNERLYRAVHPINEALQRSATSVYSPISDIIDICRQLHGQERFNYMDSANRSHAHLDGFHFYPVSQDQNCLFRSIQKDERKFGVAQLRSMANKHILKQGESFIPLFTKKDEYDLYCERIQSPDAWGDALHIIALMQVLHRPIYVIQEEYSHPPMMLSKLLDEAGKMKGEPIFLHFDGDKHYNLLRLDESMTVEQILRYYNADVASTKDADSPETACLSDGEASSHGMFGSHVSPGCQAWSGGFDPDSGEPASAPAPDGCP